MWVAPRISQWLYLAVVLSSISFHFHPLSFVWDTFWYILNKNYTFWLQSCLYLSLNDLEAVPQVCLILFKITIETVKFSQMRFPVSEEIPCLRFTVSMPEGNAHCRLRRNRRHFGQLHDHPPNWEQAEGKDIAVRLVLSSKSRLSSHINIPEYMNASLVWAFIWNIAKRKVLLLKTRSVDWLIETPCENRYNLWQLRTIKSDMGQHLQFCCVLVHECDGGAVGLAMPSSFLDVD